MGAEMTVYEFGPFSFEAGDGLLRHDGRLLELQPKTRAVLALLLARRGEVVTKDEFLEQIWPEMFVEEGSLAVQISHLRKILNADGAGGPYIVTVPKRGYRFARRGAPIRPFIYGRRPCVGRKFYRYHQS